MNKVCHLLIKMQFHSLFLSLIFLWIQFHVSNPQQHYDIPPSPCPRLFQYKFDGSTWIGELELPSPPIQHTEVILHLTLSLRASTTVSNYHILVKGVFDQNIHKEKKKSTHIVMSEKSETHYGTCLQLLLHDVIDIVEYRMNTEKNHCNAQTQVQVLQCTGTIHMRCE